MTADNGRPQPEKSGVAVQQEQHEARGVAVQQEQHEARGEWGNQCDFILSCIGYSVGLGNVWRFPYLCYKNGGGAFLVPYMITLLLAGLPLLCLELTIGQYASLAPNRLFRQLSPIFSGLGYGMLGVSFLVAVYSNVIIAWTIFYTAASFTSSLGWATCTNDYNTQNCFTLAEEKSCLNASDGTELFWNKTCYPIEDYCTHFNYTITAGANLTHCYSNSNSSVVKSYGDIGQRISSSEDYFTNYMLGLHDHNWENFGGLKWDLCLCLLAASLLVGLCLIKGVRSSGKVVYFTALFPYVVLLILLIRGATLDGAVEGIAFFITPNTTRLADPRVWSDAATQVFYSLGPSFGGWITLASYNRFKNNCMRDAIIVAFTNCATSVFAGFVVFSILGFMAKQLNKEMKDVVASGQGLVFVAYPEAVVHMPISPLWAILFFTMFITVALDSQFTMVETLTTALFDEWPQLRRRRGTVVIVASILGFILGLCMCAKGGVLMLTLIDWYSISWSLLLIALIELVLVGWVYGAEKILHSMQTEMGIVIPKPLRYYWLIMWKFATPVVLVLIMLTSPLPQLILLATSVQYVPVFYGSAEHKYEFPAWVNVIGWLIAFAPITLVIVISAYVFVKKTKAGCSFRDMLRPTAEWCPASERGKLQLQLATQPVERLTSAGVENASFVLDKL